MLITPRDNPYDYIFGDIVEKMKLDSIKFNSIVKLCREFGFTMQKVETLHPAFSFNIRRIFFLNRSLNLVAKISNRHGKVPKFNFLLPTFCFYLKNKIVSIQPFGDISTRGVREEFATRFKDELTGFDCVPDNFVIFKGLPALIDW